MRTLNRYALTAGAALLFAGCGGSQPIAAPGAMPQTPGITSAWKSTHRLSASYQQLFRFHHAPHDGQHPASGLLDVNGTLYATTLSGGYLNRGTVYRISTSGVENVIYRFQGGSDGRGPQSGLLDVNGTLYGTTSEGGGTGCSGVGCGIVYSVSTSGAEKVLYAFKGGSDGADPLAGLVDVNGTLYGTTSQGGGSGCVYSHYSVGCGTVFSVTTSGQEAVLHHFTAGSDGAYPLGDLIDVNGVLYGTTVLGGDGGGWGTVYRITSRGKEKVLYAFKGGTDGANPTSGLINVNGTLYGTTDGGGGRCSQAECGTVYSISTTGAENVIYAFAGSSDGADPVAGLIDANGLLYGTTQYGGGAGGSGCPIFAGSCGTVFSVTTGGAETVLYRFTGGTDGDLPSTPLTNVNGSLFGTTGTGGDYDRCCKVYGRGTVFTLTP